MRGRGYKIGVPVEVEPKEPETKRPSVSGIGGADFERANYSMRFAFGSSEWPVPEFSSNVDINRELQTRSRKS